MKKTTTLLLASLITCSTMVSGMARADGPGDPRWQPHGEAGGPGPHHSRGPAGHHGPDRDRGREEARRHGDYFAWNGHDFRRGRPVPPEFRGPHYRVDDWREHHLPAPPRGEYWSNIDGNYVLIAAATGVITSLILNGAFN